jgi:hypothetical protein
VLGGGGGWLLGSWVWVRLWGLWAGAGGFGVWGWGGVGVFTPPLYPLLPPLSPFLIVDPSFIGNSLFVAYDSWVTAYSREDDLVIALQQATAAVAAKRFAELACVLGDVQAAIVVTQIADEFVKWLRRPRIVTLQLVAIEEQSAPGVALDPMPEGEDGMTTIDTSQQARYVISSADDRGFPVDATLAVEATPAGVVEATIEEATSGTASGKDELVVKAVAPGSALVKVFDPAQADTVFGSDSVDVVPGGVAAVVLEAPVVEEQPTP